MEHPVPTVIALVGAGLASVRAAETLRELGYDGRVVLLGDEPHAPYDRPPLSKDLADGAPTPLLTPERAAELAVELRTGERVARLDPAAGGLVLASGERLDADRVLLATGGRARALPVPGADLPQVATLRTVEDAARLRALLAGGGRVVVVGGGFVGLEVAAAARALGAGVTVVEAADRLLARVLPAATAAVVADAHRESGVRFALGAGVREIAGDDRVREVVLGDGRRLPASCVVVGIGMTPADELARDAGLAVDDGILVDAGGTTSHPHVLAAGDVARGPDPWHAGAGPVRLEQWQSAQVQGTAAAYTMLGRTPPRPPVPWFWSDQGDLRVQVAGVPAPGQQVVHRGAPDGDHTALHLADGRLVAAVTVNRPRDIRPATQLIEAGVRVDPALLGDGSQDLRRLARGVVAAG